MDNQNKPITDDKQSLPTAGAEGQTQDQVVQEDETKVEPETSSTEPAGDPEETRLPAPERSDVGQGSQAPAYVGAPEIPEGQDQQVKENEESETPAEENTEPSEPTEQPQEDQSGAKWYVVHTYSGHENKVAAALKQRVESEHLENKIREVLVPTQEKIEIRSGKKETVKEKIFPGYILVKMVLDDNSWLAVRTTQGVTAFIGMGNKPTPIPESEVKSIVNFMTQGAQPTYKQIFSEGDTVKIVDGPFAEFIGKVDSVDKERGKVKVLVSIFGRETPVELDFLQVARL